MRKARGIIGLALLLQACDEHKRADPSPGDGQPIQEPANTESSQPARLTELEDIERRITEFRAQSERERIKRQEDATERERISKLHAFENALSPLGTKRVSKAFIVERAANGTVDIIEGLAGRLPSDPDEYVPEANASGHYLVGSIAPRAGYTIADREEQRFCFRLSPHGTYITGPGLSELLWLSDIAVRLEQHKGTQPGATEP